MLIEIDDRYATNPLCSNDHMFLGAWYHYANCAILSAFICASMVMSVRLMHWRVVQNDKYTAAYTIFFNVVAMSTVATFLNVCFNWGGICIDRLGYGGSSMTCSLFVFDHATTGLPLPLQCGRNSSFAGR